ncbi:MAG: GNAT family N-acetyltransferase [Parvibaculaceae bacterium]|nr:GNAT family N-acetyltransferase [Parvibaculaceae bacterium]
MVNETIRPATADDIEAITALTRAAYAKWVPLIGREPLPMKADYAEAFKKHRFDLLFTGSEMAALIETVPRNGDLLIENVAVSPAFRKRGYGRRLLALAEEHAREAGFPCIRLYTNALFEENIKLYLALGYEIEREEPLNGGTAVHMRKDFACA